MSPAYDYLAELSAIRECQCRPQYLALANLRQDFPKVPVAAVTATATAAVLKEMKEVLALKQPKVFIGPFNRPNMQYSVRHKELLGDGSDAAALQVLHYTCCLQPSKSACMMQGLKCSQGPCCCLQPL